MPIAYHPAIACKSRQGKAMRGRRDPETGDLKSAAAASGGCGCGAHASAAEHDAAMLAQRAVDAAVLRAVVPDAKTRRAFLAVVGAGVALRAIGDVFPLDAARAYAQEAPGPLEKKNLKIGFIPITCATPIIMAEPMGFYRKHGL
jgi:nitrate/nitrite transport system substrate-binding protein